MSFILPNRTGKGGFLDNPQNINRSGKWKPENSMTYQLRIMETYTEEELNKVANDPKETISRRQAANSHLAALTDRQERTFIADRNSGKPIETVRTQEIDNTPIKVLDID